MLLLQTLLFGQSVTFWRDSGHRMATQSGLQYSVRQAIGQATSQTESLGPRVCFGKQ